MSIIGLALAYDLLGLSGRPGPLDSFAHSRAVALTPFAPELRLRMPGLFAHASFTRGNAAHEIKCLAPQRIHGCAIQISSGVHVHLMTKQIEPGSIRHHFDGGNK